MKQRDIVERAAREAGIARPEAQAAVGAVFASIAKALARGEAVSIFGFGRLARTERAARTGRNPRTGEPLAIGRSSGVSFRAGRTLKDALN